MVARLGIPNSVSPERVEGLSLSWRCRGKGSPSTSSGQADFPLRLDVLHLVRDVVEGRVAIDLVRCRFEQFTGLVGVRRDDVGRFHHPQTHPFLPPGVGVARVRQRELPVRSMNTADMAMAKTTL